MVLTCKKAPRPLKAGLLVAATLLLGQAINAAPAPPGRATGAVEVAPAARPAATVVDAFHRAMRRGDTKLALSYLAGDALIFEAGGVERGRAEYAAHHLSADAEFAQAVPATLIRRVGRSGGGSFAWIASEGRTTGTFKGKPVDRRTTETMLLRRTGSTWEIIHIHWSSAAAGK
jgi:ketosteroid isomerase-like protein